MAVKSEMTDQEEKIIQQLAEVWNAIFELPDIHRAGALDEYAADIHHLQNRIAARGVWRSLNKIG